MASNFIRTRKINRILIEYKNLPAFIFAIIYDGPGFLSPVSELKNNLRVISSSSFQCILQFMIYRKSVEDNSLSFWVKPLSIQQSIVVKRSEIVSLVLLSDFPGTYVKTVLIKTTAIFQIRGTLEMVNYTRPYDPTCLYGGLVVGEYSNKNFEDSFTVCDSTREKVSRSFYSRQSSLMLLLYWYREYSDLNVSVIFSQTTCRSVLFDPCVFRRECFSGYKACVNYLKSITLNSGVSFTSTSEENVDLGLSNNGCAIIQVATNEIKITPMKLAWEKTKCNVHFSSITAGTSITKITGEFKKLIVKLPFTHGIEMYRMRKAYFCKETSKKYCVKDDLGFNMPHIIQSKYVIPNESTFKINIQISKYELITDVKLGIKEFSKSWLNIFLEKVETGTEIQLNQIAQILSTANHDVFLPFPTNFTVKKCSITLQVNNISHPDMDDIFLHVTYYQMTVFDATSDLLSWRYAFLGLVSKYNNLQSHTIIFTHHNAQCTNHIFMEFLNRLQLPQITPML